MRLGVSPRSRVFVILVPIVFLLLITYPYFRSFTPSDSVPLFDKPFRQPSSSRPGHDPSLHSHPHGKDKHKKPHVPVPGSNRLTDENINEEDLIPSGLGPRPTVTPRPTSTRTKVTSTSNPDQSFVPFPFPAKFGSHPIDNLVKDALKEFDRLKKKTSNSLEEAAAAYRKARGRHPPPGFAEWYQFAKEKDSIIIEDFFNPIYEDLEPFWSLSPSELRDATTTWSNVVSIRKGIVTKVAHDGSHEWLGAWADTFRPIAKFLPDVDFAFNTFDEPRVVVPWHDIDNAMQEARRHRNLGDPHKLITQYQQFPDLDLSTIPKDTQRAWKEWHKGTPYWDFARAACHPDSPAHGTQLSANFSIPPTFPQILPDNSREGFVANWTFSKSVCRNPHLRNLHGNFIALLNVSVNRTLFPVFSGSKHQDINNDIRVPAAKYWKSKRFFGGDQDISTVDAKEEAELTTTIEPDIPWDAKDSKLFWRGTATGGDHDESNWRGFHRQRFISMLNSTEVSMTELKLENLTSLDGADMLESEPPLPHNFPFPNSRLYPLTALTTHPTTLGSWLEPLTDAGFVHLMCHPQRLTVFGKGNKCVYLNDYYHVTEKVSFNESFIHKYLPDVDGNGYSGRYRAFLRSTSLPIKATVHSEWHDTRIVPWAHFIPMDNTFVDLYSILEYFAGNPDNDGDDSVFRWALEWIGWHSGGHDGGGTHGHGATGGGHDDMGRAIAEHGKDWADKVLRKEDMVVYMHRLVLEWARLNNDQRDQMGWAEDLKNPNQTPLKSSDSNQENQSDNQDSEDLEDDDEEQNEEDAEEEEEDQEEEEDEDTSESQDYGEDEMEEAFTHKENTGLLPTALDDSDGNSLSKRQKHSGRYRWIGNRIRRMKR